MCVYIYRDAKYRYSVEYEHTVNAHMARVTLDLCGETLFDQYDDALVRDGHGSLKIESICALGREIQIREIPAAIAFKNP